jgi:hypothetical protein
MKLTSVMLSSNITIYSVLTIIKTSIAISKSMHQCNALRLPTRCAKQTNALLARQRQAGYSSGSPIKTKIAADHFTKTGEKPLDPADNVGCSDEYSQSGGDDMVAQQSGTSFDVRSCMACEYTIYHCTTDDCVTTSLTPV